MNNENTCRKDTAALPRVLSRDIAQYLLLAQSGHGNRVH
jgi:hypothetical protein